MGKAEQFPSISDGDRLELVLELGCVAWWEMDVTTGDVIFHPRKASMLGYAAERFRDYTDFTALLHPDDHEPAMQAMRDHLSGAAPEYRLDYRIRASTGEYRWFQDVGRISRRDETGRPVTVSGIVLDISDRKRVEAVLAASEDRFRRLFDGHSATTLILDPTTGRIVDANPAAAQFYGWSVAELRAMRIQQINTLPVERVSLVMANAAQAGGGHFEFRHRRADGTTRDVEVHSNAVEIAGQGYLHSIVHDITDRRSAETSLRESERRYRLLAEHANDVIWIVDLHTRRFRYVSPSVFRLRGYTAEEAMEEDFEASVTEESLAEIRRTMPEHMRQYVKGERTSWISTVEQPHKDGSTVWVEMNVRYVRNEATGHLEAIGVSRDVTERKRAEIALEAADQRLRQAEAFARFGHWQLALSDRIMHASDGAMEIYGVTERSLPLSTVRACALPECRRALEDALRALIEEGKPYDLEFEIRRVSDGQVVTVHSKARYDEANGTIFGVLQDITARKRIEREREKLIEQLRRALEQIKTLRGIVPICACCKKIRDDHGFWEQVEAYVSRHTEAEFSHGICPACLEKFYPET